MFKRPACLFALIVPLCAPLAASASAEAQLVMIAPLNQTMPLTRFQNNKLTGGILKDLGEAIARRLGRGIAWISVSGDQVSATLDAGTADGICYVRPFWIDGHFDWSRPLIPDAEVVASQQGAPPVRSLADLRDRPVGTVSGYRYPRVEQVLGLRFQRSESVTMEENLRKLMAGSVRHTVIGQATLAYQMRINKALKLRQDLVFASFKAQCAFSKKAGVPFEDVDQAINGLIEDGSVEAILARYR
ncbi:transporter substrate-binding domain-containing protein [Massilia sp. CCM 8733]|uniref:Transporter substrate-binding domain-containing protein n=1 Tax=Massilia mucilaginosa TaxID=2609282 RepID=A0ABX0NR95_9BURK|nr:transporter substrate-binding domain-containing protein [Massilia mucilaginosa]NHZ89378.1 transporter substrate-binding domain-containing protein [Massilia mucilaginosa]